MVVSFAITGAGVSFNQARILGCTSLALWLDVIEHSWPLVLISLLIMP